MGNRTMMLLGGSVIGASLALLFAPYSGAKSRKKVRKFGKMMSNKSDRWMRDFTDFADTVGGRASKFANMWH